MIKLSFLGDIMCLKAQNDAVMKKHGEYRYDGYLSGLAPLLKDSNYVIANLESPIMRSPYTQDNITQSDVCFATPSSLLDEVKAAGIDFVATCNNHCLDRGVDGLSETLRCIKAAGIDCSGSYLTVGDSEKVFVKQVGTLKVAVICCTFGTNSQLNGVFLNEDEQWRIDLTKKQQKLLKLEFKTSGEGKSIEKYISDDVSPAAITNSKNQVFLERVLEKVHKAKEVADIVVAYPHVRGQYNPSPGFYTRFIIDSLKEAGADIIVANHPHTSLRCERLDNGVFCAYALGNLAFTPDVGFFLDNVLAEFGIVLHSYWDESTKRLIKLTFNVTRCMIGEDGITRVVEVSELYNRLTNKSERERLMIDNESVVNRFAGWAKSFEPYKEYVIF
jgi:bacterial capsule synthesis protein